MLASQPIRLIDDGLDGNEELSRPLRAEGNSFGHVFFGLPEFQLSGAYDRCYRFFWIAEKRGSEVITKIVFLEV
jgi:hypothetical protein